MPWRRVSKFNAEAVALADRHYSRRTRGSRQFMPPGQTVVLLHDSKQAVFGWWRPAPSSGITLMSGLDGWTCTIFRNEGAGLSSQLILEAEQALYGFYSDCGADGLLTYVWDARVRSSNPGMCFKRAGWTRHPLKPRSADRRKTLLTKPWRPNG